MNYKTMNLRKYGNAPYKIAVVHGGPGAAGEMAPVARELSTITGVLEPLQTATTLKGQAEELISVLKENGDLPVTLIGYSWGAFLSYIVAAQHQPVVRKLILVSCGPFEEEYAESIKRTRLSRLNEQDRKEVGELAEKMKDPQIPDKNRIFARWGELLTKGDGYDTLPHGSEIVEFRYDINQKVWEQAVALRRSGKLLELGNKIKCPVVAIHGDYDSHPAAGANEPLSRVIKDFRFILLQNCGHTPWLEKQARDKFFRILEGEI